MPNGWRVRPAGEQVAVFNFPLGLAISADRQTAVVSSGSGGMQGLTAIDTGSLKPTLAPAANLFMGLAVTDTGKLYASGGNADRVFRYQLAGGVPVTLDATEAIPQPLHHARDGIVAQTGAGNDVLPALDGVRVTGYPGNAVAGGNHVFVAGSLSEPSGSGADACPGAQLVCARVSILDATTDTVVGRAPVGRDAYALALDAPAWAAQAFGIEIDLLALGDISGTETGKPVEITGSVTSTLGATSSSATTAYQPVPAMPAIEVDLALIVPDSLQAADVERVITKSAGALLEKLVLFDEFRGGDIPAGSRSLAWALTFRHPERTLRDREIQGRTAKIVKTLEEELGIKQRSA